MSDEPICDHCKSSRINISYYPYCSSRCTKDSYDKINDEWIFVNIKLPVPNVFVEIRYDAEDKNPQEAQFKQYFTMNCCNYDHYVWVNRKGNMIDIKVNQWRPIKEKRHDFSKLSEGDLLFAETLNGVFAGFYYCMADEGICLLGKKNARFIYAYSVQEIKKITRINIEKQTFEEI